MSLNAKNKEKKKKSKGGEGRGRGGASIWCKRSFFKKEKILKNEKLRSFAFYAIIFVLVILCTTCGLKCEIWGIK